MRFKHRCHSGYTFVEITIVVLIMGLLAAVAAPTYVSTVTKYRVDMAARKIVADLHFARAEALRNSLSRTVQFDTTNNRYELLSVESTDRTGTNYLVELVDEPFYSALVSATFNGDEAVVFDRFGRPDSVGTVVVQAGGLQKTVSLAADGRATML